MADTEAGYRELALGGTFVLTSPTRPIKTEITLPGDVHTALIAAGEIPEPYFGQNEDLVQWVYQTAWTVERRFVADAADLGLYLTLTLSEVDCLATVKINGEVVAQTDNAFLRHDIDVTGRLREGENVLCLEFAAVPEVARARYEAHPFAIPYSASNQRVAHLNFVRKVACHAGWDWGICLMPIGVYGRMALRCSRLARQESVQVTQAHGPGSAQLTITTRLFACAAGTVALSHEIDGQRIADQAAVQPGENVLTHQVTIERPRLWWPAGQGEQPLYSLTTTLDGEVTRRSIGLRQLEWVVEADAIDHSFQVRVNGRDVTMMGANWIPADAIPARITPEAVRDLLESARAANMNMLRVWGGGQYEPDYFYQLCDELGILVWQDFMFSCMPYPSDRGFLASVRVEVTQQARRLQHHASLALWCGDNECIGSLTWFPETRANRDRFVANYDRLNSMLAEIVADEDPGRRFWPSSPSLGYLDFADGWHVDTRGDMHYWDVWHSARPFEAYREQHPRFASEFGFQSFPSMNVVESFTQAGDRNPSSPVMEAHQRNEGGNARILETMTRYFRFPKDFDAMVFLSQVQQGLAMKTAIEYWRSTKPRCMGTLFWQINDTWPVASWASLDYGGQWKLLHYMARRFFLAVNVVAVPEAQTGSVVLRGINDSARDVAVDLELVAVDMAGGSRALHSGQHVMSCDAAIPLATVPAGALHDGEFLWFRWSDASGTVVGHNDFFPRAYKHYEPHDACVAARWSHQQDGATLVLTTDRPSFFVTASVAAPGYFSDNAVTLLPGRETQLRFHPRFGQHPKADILSSSLQVRHLRQTY